MQNLAKLKARMPQKHDLEINWIKAVNFIPMRGEIIVYDADENYNYERFKIGDGLTTVGNLPFTVLQPDWIQTDPTKGDYIKNKPEPITNEEIDRICGMTIISEDDYTDVTTGINYKLYVDNGKLHMAEVE